MTNFFWKKFPWPASQEQFQYQKDGFINMLKKRYEVRRETFQLKKDKKIFIEADEMWTYVGSKENDIWLALERRTGLVVGCHIGKRDDAGASALWDSLSEDCKKNGIFFTDGLSSLRKSISSRQTQSCRQRKRENKSY